MSSELEKLKVVLEANGFQVSTFPTGEEAAAYLNRSIDHTTVGMGGSVTLTELGLQQSLSAHNILYNHGFSPCSADMARDLAAGAEVYVLSANGIAADTGEIINIDGCGNRAASSLYGHKKVYFVAGKNKISPKNAQRLHRKTPCAAKGDRCYNCNSPERICNGLVVLYKKMQSMDMEVVLIDQELGY